MARFESIIDSIQSLFNWSNRVTTCHNRLKTVTDWASRVTIYHWDAAGRLTGIDCPNGTTRTTADGTTTYVFDPHGDALPRVLVRERPDESLTYYVYGIGLIYEVDEADDATYYHFDQSGSTIALTDGAGAVTDRIEYTPYGTVSHRSGETDTPFLYAGQFGIQTDPNGLLHMRARYYSPELKRFVNADPAGFGGGLNWYAYANNSPLMYVDPDGEIAIPFIAIIIVGGIIGGAIDAGVTSAHDHYFGGGFSIQNSSSAFLRRFITGAISTVASPIAGFLVRASLPLARNALSVGISASGGLSGQFAHNLSNPNYSLSEGLGQAFVFGGIGGGLSNSLIATPRWGHSLNQMKHFAPKNLSTVLSSENSWLMHKSTLTSSIVSAGSNFLSFK